MHLALPQADVVVENVKRNSKNVMWKLILKAVRCPTEQGIDRDLLLLGIDIREPFGRAALKWIDGDLMKREDDPDCFRTGPKNTARAQ